MKITIGPIRLYPGRDDDLINQVAAIRPAEYGILTHEIKAALRRGWGLTGEQDAPLETELLARLDALPGQLREIVDAAIAGIVVVSQAESAADEDAEFAQSLINEFMLQEDK
jgi:hypothetical protein